MTSVSGGLFGVLYSLPFGRIGVPGFHLAMLAQGCSYATTQTLTVRINYEVAELIEPRDDEMHDMSINALVAVPARSSPEPGRKARGCGRRGADHKRRKDVRPSTRLRANSNVYEFEVTA